MGEPETGRWIYRFIIGQATFLDLENSEHVPVWTVVLPAWTLNTLVNFSLWKYTFETVIDNQSLDQILCLDGIPFLQRIFTGEKLLQNSPKNWDN